MGTQCPGHRWEEWEGSPLAWGPGRKPCRLSGLEEHFEHGVYLVLVAECGPFVNVVAGDESDACV